MNERIFVLLTANLISSIPSLFRGPVQYFSLSAGGSWQTINLKPILMSLSFIKKAAKIFGQLINGKRYDNPPLSGINLEPELLRKQIKLSEKIKEVSPAFWHSVLK